MAKINLTINGDSHEVDVDPNMPLLWVLRDELGLHGTKYGCGIAMCGSCTVHINGTAVRSCSIRVGEIKGEVQTIESAQKPNQKTLQVVQEAWIENQVAQCGYCQPGQVMAAATLLRQKSKPTDTDIDQYMSANLCRCGTYPRVRKAIHEASNKLNQKK